MQSGNLGCTSEPFGLKSTAPGVTLDLNLFKIFARPRSRSETWASS